ncbi:hypothetical protein [Rhizobium sp. TRM95796]|uniref:hypothetical protein n=1 Tax=Rhizobium sp. TRM95796 TaxID=2979862 RepID=UPI0021E7B8C4|nr:hypothetical protein [Rhizobium sp. TRM95796]MCV3769086.1 hypothetical protein [Rhizobium sp. TRM95796]
MSRRNVNYSQVVDGLRYNTETAIEICTYYSTADVGDFTYECTTLFQTKKGRFFIAGHGGPRSRWSRSLGNNTIASGEGLRPISAEEARRFAEQNADPDTVTKYFDVDDA